MIMTNHDLAPCSADMPSSNMSTVERFKLFGKKPVLATEIRRSMTLSVSQLLPKCGLAASPSTSIREDTSI
jgi:hypothetical protein